MAIALGGVFAIRHFMQELASPERRRVRRSTITASALSVLALSTQVRLLDISLGGVLIEASHPVDAGSRGTLLFNFGGVPFSAEVYVERIGVHRDGTSERFQIGAAFVALSPEDQRVIKRFANQ